MNIRWQEILKQLMNSNEPLTSSQLGTKIQVSSKTIRNDVKDLNIFLKEHNIQIDSYRGRGYQLNESYRKPIKFLLQNHLEAAKYVIPTDPEGRVQYLIEKLLLESDYLKIEDLADELFISRSTLQGDLKQVRKIFQKYNLILEHKPNYGMKVCGNEIQIRFCMSEHIFYDDSIILDYNMDWLEILPKDELEIIKNSILKRLRENHIIITDISLQNLITHIAIACKRIREKNDIEIIQEELKEVKKKKEFTVAQEIVSDIGNKLEVMFGENEVAYLTIHLQGTNLINSKIEKEEIRSVINDDIYFLVQEIITLIDKEFTLNLSDDEELLLALSLHLKPAISRYKYQMNLRNPMLEEIKRKYRLSFEAALLGAGVLYNYLNIKIDENEIGYLALHIEAALERQKKNNKNLKRCLIVCASGLGSAQLLLYKLKEKFSNDLDVIGTTEYYNLSTQSLHNIDFIISTIPIQESLGIPIIHVSTILGGNDVIKIKRLLGNDKNVIEKYMREEYTYLNMDFHLPIEVIQFLGEELIKDDKVNENYIESVLERESFSPTSFGNLVAIPHPNEPQTEETFWSIVTLRRPIIWGDKVVQFICLLNINKQTKEDLKPMYHVLTKLLDNEAHIQRLLQCETYLQFKTTLKELN